MMKTAVLIDGAFLNKIIKKDADPEKQALRIIKVANLCVEPNERLYRIFYYDCGPFEGIRHDLSGTTVDFSKTPQCAYQKSLLAHIARQPYTATTRLALL